MAGIFSPNLQSQVTPESPIQMASPIASLAQLGESVVGGLARSRDRAEREARASAPSYTQLKDEREAAQLSDYSAELQRLEGLKGQVSAQAYNLELRKVNLNYLDNLSSPSFVAARETITGLPDERIGRTDSEILINQLSLTATGQAEISFAAQQLNAQGQDATPDSVAAVIRQREVTKLSVANMQIQDEASFRQAKPAINELINMFTKDTQNSVFTLRDAGVPITGVMVQNRYEDFLKLKTQITSPQVMPANIPETQKEDILKSLQRTEDFFVQLGMTKENGEIKLLNTNELEVQEKVKTYVSVLNKSENGADQMLALKVMSEGYKLDPLTYDLLDGRLAALGTETDVMPDWITEADIVVTNDLIGTYENLVAFQQSGGLERFTQDNKMKDGAISLVNPEERAKWSGMTNAQGWTATKAFGTASKGYSKEAILSGNMTDGFYNSMAGLALSFESIDIVEEPISFNGVRSEVSSKLPDLIKTAEAVDPVKGAAIKSLMFRSLTSQKFQYDTRLASDESTLGVTFNPSTRTYNLTSNTSDPVKLTIAAIVNKRYNGDLVAATEDGFSRTTSEDLASLPSPSATQTDINRAVYTLRGLAPQVSEVKDLLDLRSSSVYLSNLASQIEPQSSKDAREAAASAIKGLAVDEPGGVTSDIDPSMITGFNIIADDGAFLGAVENTSQNLGINSADLLTAISFETVGTFNPSSKNPGSTATGLIQFLESTAKGLGTSTSALAQMSRVEQMEYVEKYLRPYKGRMKNLGDVYMAIHWPAGVGKDDSYVMYREGSNYYAANRRLDVSGDGTVTRGEALQRVRQSAGSGGQGAIPAEQRITTTKLPTATTEGTTSTPVSQAPVVGGQGVAPVESVQATAELPTEGTQQATPQGEAPATRPAASGPTTPPEITALLEVIGSRNLSDDEVTLLKDWIAGLGG